MNLFNHTPHDVSIYAGDELQHSFPAVLPTIRLENTSNIDQHPLIGTVRIANAGYVVAVAPPRYDGINYIPEPDKSCVIVSSMVAEFIMNRPDLVRQFEAIFAPDTSPQGVVRNKEGQIVGTRRLVQYK